MVNRPGASPGEQFHDLLGHEAALVAVGEPAEGVQQGVGDLERDHAEDLRAGDGKRTTRLLVQEPSQEQPIAPEAERGDQRGPDRRLAATGAVAPGVAAGGPLRGLVLAVSRFLRADALGEP